MKHLIFISLGALLLLALGVFWVDVFLPVEHTVTVTQTIKSPVDGIWKKITTFPEYASWRKSLTKIEMVSENEWIETDNHGNTIPFKIQILNDRKKVKVEITGKDLEFGGYWIIELTGDGDSTDVTITENGEVYNVFFRVISKFVFGYDANVKEYLNNLQQLGSSM